MWGEKRRYLVGALSRMSVARNENGSAKSVSQPRPRERLKGSGAMRQSQRAVGGNAVLFLRVHLAEGSVMSVREKDGIVAETGPPRGGKTRTPFTRPSNVSSAPSGQASASTLTKAARQGGGAGVL